MSTTLGVAEAKSRLSEAERSGERGWTLPARDELQHVRRAVLAAPMLEEPSAHTYIENFFSDETYAAILRLFPTDPKAFRRWADPRDGKPRFANYACRQEIDIWRESHALSDEQRAFWMAMSDLLCGPEFARLLFERFAPYARERFGAALDEPNFIEEQLRGTMILNQHDADYYLGPHTDRGEKVFTCIFYFPEHDGLDHLGTSLYAPREPGFTCDGSAHHDPALFELTQTMPYRANSAFIFARTDVLFHGVHALSKAELGDSRRRGIQMQFWRRNERPRHECLVTVAASPPAAMLPSERANVSFRILNRAKADLASSFPNTTQIGYRWFAADGTFVPEGSACIPLRGVLPCNAELAGELSVVAPPFPGRYTLRISVVQESVAWFDDLDAANGFSGLVRVGDVAPNSQDVFPAWAEPGNGFYPLEEYGGSTFRWVGNSATITILNEHGDELVFEAESGPGLGSKPFDLHVTTALGETIANVVVGTRTTVRVPLGNVACGGGLTLQTPPGASGGASDPRVLNFRIFR